MSVARTPRTDPKSSPESTPPEMGAETSEDLAAAPEVAASEPIDLTEEGTSDAPASESGHPEKPAPHQATPSSIKVERRGGFFPLVFGGLAAGGIGFGTAAYVLPGLFPVGGDAVAVAAVESAVKAQADKLAALDRGLGDLRRVQEEQAAAPAVPQTIATDIADVAEKLDKLAQSVAALEEKVGAFDARLTRAEQRPVTGDAASASALQAVQREMDSFRSEIAAQKQAAEAVKGEITAAASAAAARLDSVRADAEKMRSDAEAAAREAMVKGGISRIEAALESGTSLADPIAALTSAGVSVPASLIDQAQGVPTLAALRDSFPDAARKALAVSVADESGSSAWTRIAAFFRSQSGARSLTPRSGEDPDAVLSRAEASLRAGDVSRAVEELKALPEVGQAAMSEWVARADRRMQAVAALKQLVE